ncbi:OadG family protein [Desemzia sp. FAM 24101]|uniref:OadG family protein n=1 Tax=unclassified Desemzia TaxID=2685243 RepID=UPI003888152D
MGNFTVMDGVVVTVISMLVVFLILIGLQLVISLSRIVLERQKEKSQAATTLVEDEETRTAAALMALILANEEQQNKHYQITSIKRIR